MREITPPENNPSVDRLALTELDGRTGADASLLIGACTYFACFDDAGSEG